MNPLQKMIIGELVGPYDIEKVSLLPAEDRVPEVLAATSAFQALVPTAFENVNLPDLSEAEIIEEVAPVVASGLILMATLGEDAEVSVVDYVKEQFANMTLPEPVDEDEESDDIDCEDD